MIIELMQKHHGGFGFISHLENWWIDFQKTRSFEIAEGP
jgi:hypothetical protein